MRYRIHWHGPSRVRLATTAIPARPLTTPSSLPIHGVLLTSSRSRVGSAHATHDLPTRPMSNRFNKPNKVGRNDSCPCGSGRKYKHCCLRSGEIQLEPSGTISWEEESAAAAKAIGRGMCCAPPNARHDCVPKIVRSHTVPRSSLSHIAEKGHVLSCRADVISLKTHGTAPPPKPRGIQNASTFTGFCARHDHDIFRPLETAPFTSTPEQCFLLAYRALARELYLKTNTRVHYESRTP